MKSKRTMLLIWAAWAFMPLIAASKSDDFDFVVFGDSRIAAPGAPIPEAYKRILTECELINPDLMFHTGDLIFGYGETPKELEREYADLRPLKPDTDAKIYYVPGNHDYHDYLSTKYFKKMTGEEKEYFSIEHKGVKFIILNTELFGEAGRIVGDQFNWLKQELENGQDDRAIFVFMHRPLFSSPYSFGEREDRDALLNPLKSEQEKLDRQALLDLLVKYHVTAVFSGHEHLYYRTDYRGIPFITVGGGGATFSAPPERGGFFSYMIVSLKGSHVRYNLMEPYQFSVATTTYNQNGKTYGEAVINNIHGGMEKGAITLRGIRFNLPAADYEAKAESVVAPLQLLETAPFLKLLQSGDTITQSERSEKVRAIIVEHLNAKIYKTEPNPNNPRMVQVWVSINVPGTFPIRLTVSPVAEKNK